MSDYKELREALEKATRVVMFTNAAGNYEYGVDPGYIKEFNEVANAEAIAALLAERDALLDQHHRDSKELRSLCAARDEVREQRDSLRKAIAVFAECADELDGSPQDGIQPTPDDEWAKFRLLASDYRRARAALGEKP